MRFVDIHDNNVVEAKYQFIELSMQRKICVILSVENFRNSFPIKIDAIIVDDLLAKALLHIYQDSDEKSI